MKVSLFVIDLTDRKKSGRSGAAVHASTDRTLRTQNRLASDGTTICFNWRTKINQPIGSAIHLCQCSFILATCPTAKLRRGFSRPLDLSWRGCVRAGEVIDRIPRAS